SMHPAPLSPPSRGRTLSGAGAIGRRGVDFELRRRTAMERAVDVESAQVEPRVIDLLFEVEIVPLPGLAGRIYTGKSQHGDIQRTAAALPSDPVQRAEEADCNES